MLMKLSKIDERFDIFILKKSTKCESQREKKKRFIE